MQKPVDGMGVAPKPSEKRPRRSSDQPEATNGIAAVDCCKIFVTGSTQRFVCKYPGCAREYASRDAVRKHCRIRHLTWLRGLVRTSAREVEVLPQLQPTDSPLGSLLSPLLTPTLAPSSSPPTAAMGNLELSSVPPLELNPAPSTPPEEEAPGFDALVNGGYLLSALSTLSTLANAAAIAANDGKPEHAFRVPISAS